MHDVWCLLCIFPRLTDVDVLYTIPCQLTEQTSLSSMHENTYASRCVKIGRPTCVNCLVRTGVSQCQVLFVCNIFTARQQNRASVFRDEKPETFFPSASNASSRKCYGLPASAKGFCSRYRRLLVNFTSMHYLI